MRNRIYLIANNITLIVLNIQCTSSKNNNVNLTLYINNDNDIISKHIL